jgi:thiol:disulfide interchange protein
VGALRILALGAAVALAGCGKSRESVFFEGEIAWRLDEARARSDAAAAGQWTFVHVCGMWAVACKELDHQTFTDPEVRRLVNHGFVPILIDASDDEDPRYRAMADKYRPLGVPTMIILDPEGRERARITEFVGPTALARVLRDVRR